MTHTTEEFVRRELRSILRGDTRVPPVLDVASMGPDGNVRWSALECARVRLS
jgi:hypothetical protein